MSNANTRQRVLFLTRFSMLLAIEAIVCFTPLGSIPIGPVVATLAMIPVIIAAIVMGTGAGAAMGLFAGIFSLIVWTLTPPNPVIAFVFTPFYTLGKIHGNVLSLLICLVPRVLTGVVAGVSFQGFSRALRSRSLKSGFVYGVSGVLGSLTNTFLVLGGILLFFGQTYAGALGVTFKVVLAGMGTVVLTNGVPEAVLGGIAGYAICLPLRKFVNKQPY